MRVDVIDRIDSLKTKRDSIKNKLKAKIKEFWKIASTPNVIHNSWPFHFITVFDLFSTDPISSYFPLYFNLVH